MHFIYVSTTESIGKLNFWRDESSHLCSHISPCPKWQIMHLVSAKEETRETRAWRAAQKIREGQCWTLTQGDAAQHRPHAKDTSVQKGSRYAATDTVGFLLRYLSYRQFCKPLKQSTGNLRNNRSWSCSQKKALFAPGLQKKSPGRNAAVSA